MQHLKLEKHRPWSLTDWFRRAWNHKEYSIATESSTYQRLKNLIETLNTSETTEKSPTITKQENVDDIVKVLANILKRVSEKSKANTKQQRESISTLFTDRVETSRINASQIKQSSMSLSPPHRANKSLVSEVEPTVVPTKPPIVSSQSTITSASTQTTQKPQETPKAKPPETSQRQLRSATTQNKPIPEQPLIESKPEKVVQKPIETPQVVESTDHIESLPRTLKTARPQAAKKAPKKEQPKPTSQRQLRSAKTKEQKEPTVTHASTAKQQPPTTKPVPQKTVQKPIETPQVVAKPIIETKPDSPKIVQKPIETPQEVVKPDAPKVVQKEIEIPQKIPRAENEPHMTYQLLFQQLRASEAFVDESFIGELIGLQDNDYILTLARNEKGYYHAELQVWREKDKEFKHIPLLVTPSSGYIMVDTIGSDRPKNLPITKPKAPTDKVEILPLYSATGFIPSCPSVRSLERVLEEYKGFTSIRKRQAK